MHASSTRPKATASQRIMRSESRRIQIPLPYIQRPPLATYPPSRSVDFVFVLEARRWKVAHWKRSSRLSSKRVTTVRPWLGERRQPIIAQGIMSRCTFSFPSCWFRSSGLALFSIMAGSMRRLLIPLLLQPWRYLLQDVDLEQGCGIRHSPCRDEGVSDDQGCFVRSGGWGYREGKGGFRDVVFWFQVKGAHFVVADRQAVDDGFGAQPADFEEVLQGGLVVGVAEGVVIGCGGVPLCGKGWGF